MRGSCPDAGGKKQGDEIGMVSPFFPEKPREAEHDIVAVARTSSSRTVEGEGTQQKKMSEMSKVIGASSDRDGPPNH